MMNRSASLLMQSNNFESSSYAGPLLATSSTSKLNQLAKSEKFEKSKKSKSAKLVNRNSLVKAENDGSKKATPEFESVELYSLESATTNQRNNTVKVVKRSYQSRIKIAIDELPFNKMSFNTNNFIQKSSSDMNAYNAKIKQTQRNKIYALNSLMTSLEYENYLQFCIQNNIKVN